MQPANQLSTRIFTLFFASFTLLTKRLFGTNRPLTLYVFIVAGTLPWFFVLSRIAFEVISQLAVVTAALLFVHRTFVSRHVKWHDPVLAGLLLGLSLYTYPTARLLTPLLLVTIALFFFRRSTLKQSIVPWLKVEKQAERAGLLALMPVHFGHQKVIFG